MWTIAGRRGPSATRAATAGDGMWVWTTAMSWARTSRRRRPSQATLVGWGASRQWTGMPAASDLVDEGVLPRQQVGDLDPVAGPVEVPHRAARAAARCRPARGPSSTSATPTGARPSPVVSTHPPRHVPRALGRHHRPIGYPDRPRSRTSRPTGRRPRRSRTGPGSAGGRPRPSPRRPEHLLRAGGEGGDVAGRDEHAGLAVGDDLGHRADVERRPRAGR